MVQQLDDNDWKTLLGRIKDGKCTPFLGAGACAGTLPTGYDIARKWANDYDYPLKNTRDLVEVSQFVAIKSRDVVVAKERILEELKLKGEKADRKFPDFTRPSEPHSILAELPLPIYMTTNYDDFMVEALRHHKKNPKRELCRWNSYLREEVSSAFESGYMPTPAEPVVFHLHGYNILPESLVLMEDDYLDFLVNVTRDDDQLLPKPIQKAISGSSLLFMGYGLNDWSFRVLFRGLVRNRDSSLRRISITVQLPPASDEMEESLQQQIQAYRSEYLSQINIRAYWGEASKFAEELRQRWEAFEK